MKHARKPCTECPWRKDVPVGRFPPERYVALANTATDMASCVFACHKSPYGEEFACAGFLLRGAQHNLTVRMARSKGCALTVSDGGHPLFKNYREVAVANGVDPDHPALERVRDDQ